MRGCNGEESDGRRNARTGHTSVVQEPQRVGGAGCHADERRQIRQQPRRRQPAERGQEPPRWQEFQARLYHHAVSQECWWRQSHAQRRRRSRVCQRRHHRRRASPDRAGSPHLGASPTGALQEGLPLPAHPPYPSILSKFHTFHQRAPLVIGCGSAVQWHWLSSTK